MAATEGRSQEVDAQSPAQCGAHGRSNHWVEGSSFKFLAGQQLLHHKPPAVLQFQVFCFWSARGILTAQATLTQ
jgi:hypothetical protein